MGKAERFSEEELLLREVVADFPDDADARVRLAALVAGDRPAEAGRLLRAAAELAVDDPLILTRCVSHMFDLEELEDALRYAVRARESIVGDATDFVYFPQLLHLYGRLVDRHGWDTEAEEALTLAFELERLSGSSWNFGGDLLD